MKPGSGEQDEGRADIPCSVAPKRGVCVDDLTAAKRCALSEKRKMARMHSHVTDPSASKEKAPGNMPRVAGKRKWRQQLDGVLPRKAIQDAACGRSLEKAHWRPKDRKGHPLMKLARSLYKPTCISLIARDPRELTCRSKSRP